MKRWMHKFEIFVDKIIPYSLIVLLIVIVLELGFHDFVEHHHLGLTLSLIDYCIISLFVIDLIFKYLRTRQIPKFLKRYWLDILAVFPFFLMFRVFEFFAGAVSLVIREGAQTTQTLLHEGLEIEKEGSKLIKEAEKTSKLRRSSRFMRFLRPILRIPRFLKVVPKFIFVFDKPKHKKSSPKKPSAPKTNVGTKKKNSAKKKTTHTKAVVRKKKTVSKKKKSVKKKHSS